MLNHNFRQCVVHEGLRSTSAKGCWAVDSASLFPSVPVPPMNRAPLKPCSSGPSPNCRALGGLLFIAVKALTPYCAVVSGWIQHRAMLCRPQLFYAWVGWLGGSGSGHIFRIRLDGLTISLCCACVLLSLSVSVCDDFSSVAPSPVVSLLFLYRPSLFTLNFCCIFKTANLLSFSLLMCSRLMFWSADETSIWKSSNIPQTFLPAIILYGLGDFQAASFSFSHV